MTEGEPHKKAVARYKAVLHADGWQILANSDKRGERGFEFPYMATDRGPIQWTADFCAEKNHVRLVCEVDGKLPGQGHATKRADDKREFRTHFLKYFFGMVTVAIDTDVLVGRKAQPDEMILKQVAWRLTQK